MQETNLGLKSRSQFRIEHNIRRRVHQRKMHMQEKGHHPSAKRTRNGVYNETRNPLNIHPTGNNKT